MPAAWPPRSCTRAPPSPQHIPPTRPGARGLWGAGGARPLPGPAPPVGSQAPHLGRGVLLAALGPCRGAASPPTCQPQAGILVQPPGGSAASPFAQHILRALTPRPMWPLRPSPSSFRPSTTRPPAAARDGAQWASAVGMPPLRPLRSTAPARLLVCTGGWGGLPSWR